MSNKPVFDYSGIVSTADLKDKEFDNIFRLLEQSQQQFSTECQHLIDAGYRDKWPMNPLHWWSRIWEYPYVYFHLKSLQATATAGSELNIADLGSGVTFFPFLLNKEHFRVTCFDTDPICVNCLQQITALKQTTLSAQLIREGVFPVEAKTFDVIYCISVLEHVDDFSSVIKEILRTLKEDGILILTIDLDLNGLLEIGPERHSALIQELEQHFEYHAPLRVIHPSLNLTNRNSLYPWVPSRTPMRVVKNTVKSALQMKPEKTDFSLAVQTLILKRKKVS